MALCALLLAATTADSPAQPIDTSLPDMGAPATGRSGFDWRRIGLQSDNDEYTGFNESDRWYSSGVRLDVLGTESRPVPDAMNAATGCPTTWLAAVQGSGRGYVSFGQDIYTQNRRTQTEPNPDDRPVAGLLYVQAGRSLRQATTRADVRIEVGVTGPASRGEQAQDTIHSILGVDQVPLWRNQLEEQYGANLYLGCLRQIRFAAANLQSSVMNIRYDLAAGNLLSEVGVGVSFAYGPDARRLHVPRVARRVDPVRERVRQWVLGAGVGVRAVFLDALVDGEATGYQSRVESRQWQGDAFISLSVALGGNWQVSYTLTRRTPDFDGPGYSAQGFKPQTVGLIAIEAPLE